MKEKTNELKYRLKENFSKNKIGVTLLLLLWVVAIFFTLYSYRNSLGKISSGNEEYDNVVELYDGVVVEELLKAEEGSDSIAIKFATFARKNKGSFNISVTGESTGNVYVEERIKASSLQDNAFKTFSLGKDFDVSSDRNIVIRLTSDTEMGQGAGVYYSNAKVYENSVLTINSEMQDGDLSLRFLSDSADLMLFYRIIIIWVISSFSLIILLMLLVKPKYEVLFSVIAISFGLTFWLIITPMSVPDETIHYEYSLQLSNYMMGAKDHLIVDKEYLNYDAMAGHRNVSASYERLIRKINRPLHLDNIDVKLNFDINEAYRICFVPQALGITLARLLKLNMLRTFYLGRLTNLIFYVVCVYIAIKKTPVHKLLFGILATLPIFMQQAASFSYDCYINGLTFVIIACLMKWMYEDGRIDKKEFIFVFIVNLLIAPIKVVYGLFSFLYWFVPEERFGSRKNKILSVLIVTAPAMYQLTILLFPLIYRILRKIFEKTFLKQLEAETLNVTASMLKDGGDIYSFSDVTDHPLEAIELMIRTIRVFLKTWFYASFGRALSGNSLILPTYLVHSILAILVISAMREEEHTGSVLFKIVILGICVFGGLMMVGGMLISWTEVDQEIIEDYGGPVIQGIQGRYFSPFLPYLFPMLNNKKLKITQKADPYILFAFILLVFEVIVYVLSYTFMS